MINLNSSITELAKNLALSGINLILYDPQDISSQGKPKLINEDDIKNNFILNNQTLYKEVFFIFFKFLREAK